MAILPNDPPAPPDAPSAFAVPIVDIAPYVSGGAERLKAARDGA